MCKFLYETPLAQLKENEMKRYLSIILIIAHTSVIFADTLTFKSGEKIEGKLVKLIKNYENDANGTQIVFQVEKFSMWNVQQDAVIENIDDNTFVFNEDYIYKIINDKGAILYGSKQLVGAAPSKAKVVDRNELDFFSTDLILSNGNEEIKIPLSSEIDLFLNEGLEANVGGAAMAGGLEGMLYGGGPLGFLLGAALAGADAAGGTKIVSETQYQGIGMNSDSQKYYVMTDNSVIEIDNIKSIEYVIWYENKAAQGFLIGAGIPLAIGGIILLSGDGSGDDAGKAFAGGILIVASPFLGILNALKKWRIPKKKGFDINKGAWQIDLDSMLSNTKSEEIK